MGNYFVFCVILHFTMIYAEKDNVNEVSVSDMLKRISGRFDDLEAFFGHTYGRIYELEGSSKLISGRMLDLEEYSKQISESLNNNLEESSKRISGLIHNLNESLKQIFGRVQTLEDSSKQIVERLFNLEEFSKRIFAHVHNVEVPSQREALIEVVCRSPPKIENARHDGDTQQEMFPIGRQLLYECLPGYYGSYGDGLPRAMCSDDGNWVGLTLNCSARTCGYPDDIENGWRTGYVFTYPNKVNYYCLDGFELVGPGYRTCQQNGEWSGTSATCEPVECPPLFAPVNGTKNGTGTGYGTVIRFECDKGYNFTGSAERRCQADGTWSGEPAKCEEKDCGWPGPFYNGYLIGHQTKVGGTIFFSCNTRTSFVGDAFQTQCLETGEWSNKPPTCWGQCKVPSIPNVTFQGGRKVGYFNHGTVIQYQCEEGLVPKWDVVMKCYNGTWSSLAECVTAVECPPLSIPVNGTKNGSGTVYGTVIRFGCQKGYKVIGSTERRCHADGTWSGQTAKCEAVDVECPPLFAPAHGTKNGIGTVYETAIRFDCQKGYNLIGSAERRCQADGTWSGQPATCEEIDCGWPGSFYNGKIIGYKTTVGATLYFSCNPRTSLVDDYDKTLCLETGKWSRRPPVCLGHCKVPSIPNVTFLWDGYVYDQQSVSYKCKPGLIPIGNPYILCDNGTWTSEIECVPAVCPSAPPDVLYGYWVYTSNGFKAKYQCYGGYKLKGMKGTYLTCEFGDWKRGQPRCEKSMSHDDIQIVNSHKHTRGVTKVMSLAIALLNYQWFRCFYFI